MYTTTSYDLGGTYRHHSGNVSHFVSSLETRLTKLGDRKNRHFGWRHGYWSYITHQWKCCIVLVHYEKSHKEKVLSIVCTIFYCDINDDLPCFIFLQYVNNSYTGNRPMSRIFGARDCSKFVQKWRRKIVMINTWMVKVIGIINL